MISKALHPDDYQEICDATKKLVATFHWCNGIKVPIYLPHTHRLWEYGSVYEAARARFGHDAKITCIDFGAGKSPLGPALCKYMGATVIEVDNDERLVEQRAPLAALNHPHTFVCQSLLDYRGPQVDLVACVSVMEHLPPDLQEAGWRNLMAHVRDGGLLAVTVDYSSDPKREWYSDTERETKFGPVDVERIVGWLREGGFTIDLDMTDYGSHVYDYTFFRFIAFKGPKMTSDYVDVQRRVNSYHSDGSIEGDNEPALAWALDYSKWIKAREMPCTSILDAGCRTGYAMDTFMEQFPAARVAGVDIVPEFVKRADLRSEAVVGDLQALPYDDEEFDWVFCATAIEHCPDVSLAMSELCRVARLGVRIVTDLEDEHKFKANPSHFTHHEDPLEWLVALRQPGWRLVDVHLPTDVLISMTWLKRGVC